MHIKVLTGSGGSTSPDHAVAMSSANGLVGIGFASRYWLQPRAGFFQGPKSRVRQLHPLLSHRPLTRLLLTTNLLY